MAASDLFTEILIPVLVILATILLVQDWWRYRHFPPGPRGIPLLGYMPFVGPRPYLTFSKLRQRYGDIVGLKLGLTRVVVLNDWKTAREFLVEQGEVFSGRPSVFVWDYTVRRKDIVTNDGPVWKEQRKFMIKNMKDFGFGVRSSENLILNSVHMVMDELRTSGANGKSVPFKHLFFIPIMNVVWSHTASQSVSKQDDKYRKLPDLVRKLADGFVTNNPINLIPALRYLVPGAFGFWKFVGLVKQLEDIMAQEVRKHEASYVPGQRGDFIDVFLEEIKVRAEGGKEPEPPYNHEHLIGTIENLFLAGVDTTNQTLLWAFLLAALHPEIQLKIQDEMDVVVGRNRLPSIQDSPKLPYLEAFTLEVHRYISLVAMSLPHTPLRDVTVRGFRIPAGTTVFQNIHAIHHDPEVWGDPDNFRPERFLDPNNRITKPPAYMPFSVGSRGCPGEPMAKMEVFLFLSCLLHSFTFGVPHGAPLPSLEPDFGVTLFSKPYDLTCTARDT